MVFVELDLEYRFWSFMETHPTHTALPVKAKSEAMDVLNWAWTGMPIFEDVQPMLICFYKIAFFHLRA